MRADRVYRLVDSAAGPVRVVELVEIASGEAIRVWDVPARDARKFLSALKRDLVGLDADALVERYCS